MILEYDETEKAINAAFLTLLDREFTTERARCAEQAKVQGFDADLWRRLVDAGALDLAMAPVGAGDADGLQRAGIVAEQLGSRLAPTPFVEVATAARLMQRLGFSTESVLQRVCSGESVVVVVATEHEVDGDRLLVPAGLVADAALIGTAEGIRLQIRPATPETRHATLDSSPLGLWPALADGDGTLVATGALASNAWQSAQTELRVLMAAELIGMAAQALQIGVDYANQRTQFGHPIGAYQALSHPFADCAAAIDGARLLTQRAAWSVDRNTADRNSWSSMAFVNACQVAQRTVTHSLRTHGGYGFMAEYDIQLYYRRVKARALLIGSRQAEMTHLTDGLYGAVAG